MDSKLNIGIIRIHELQLYLLCNTKGIDKSFNTHYFRHISYYIIRIYLKMTYIKNKQSMNDLVNNVIKQDENKLRDSDIKT